MAATGAMSDSSKTQYYIRMNKWYDTNPCMSYSRFPGGGAITIMMSRRKLGTSPEIIDFYAVGQLLQAAVLSS